MSSTVCPGCETGGLDPFFALDSVPVYCNVLWPSREQALSAPRARIELGFCDHCGLIFNRDFEPEKLEYTPDYENSLHFSPQFQRYASELADRLVADYGLIDRDVVEIGCGKGEFLAELCRGGRNRGVGFDPSYDGSFEEGVSTFRVIRDHYSERYTQERADLICCRHVLEHVPRPVDFLEVIWRAAKAVGGPPVYFEVPDGLWTLRDLGIWDIIYEHCSYFTKPALTHVLARSGFRSRRCYTGFEGQFLCAEARVAEPDSTPPTDVVAIRRYVDMFSTKHDETVSAWEERLSELLDAGMRVCLWGAGSKGVTFLNTLTRGREIHAVVDVNPRKHGRYVPSTAQQVRGPDSLQPGEIDTVLIMNPAYESEIRRSLEDRGLRADVRVV